MSSPELVVFQKFTSNIADAATGLLSPFASNLYSEDIIDSTVRDNVTSMTGQGPRHKAGLLVKGIEDKLKAAKNDKERKKLFDVILKVMDQNIPLDAVAEQMRGAYQEVEKKIERCSKEIIDGPPGDADSSDPAQNKINMTKALNNVNTGINSDHRNRYHLAVTVLMEGNKKVTQGKGFLQLFQIVEKKLGSSPLAISFTIAVLERSHWGDTEGLKLFASSDFVLDPHVDLCLRVHDFYNTMNDDKFNDHKSSISMSYLNSRDFTEWNQPDFVLELFIKRIVCPGDVSKIKEDSNFFDEYEKKYKITERSNTDPFPAGSGSDITPPTVSAPTNDPTSTTTASSLVPEESQVNGGGTNGTTPKRHVATDSTDNTDEDGSGQDLRLPKVDDVKGYKVDYDDEVVYLMNTTPRGYCLIINMKKDRKYGNEKDTDKLRTLFKRNLQFAFRVYNDLKKEDINNLMKNVEEASHKWSCCFVMFILAHGDRSAYFQTYDEEHYEVSSIKKQIESIEDLNGKPKLLFIQSCRGGFLDTGLEVLDGNHGEKNKTPSKIPRGSDFLTSFATIEDYAACRGADGSRFIQCLCDVFTAYHDKCDVVTMMTMVTKEVAAIARDVGLGEGNIKKDVRQNPETTFTFRKFLFFGKPPQWVYAHLNKK